MIKARILVYVADGMTFFVTRSVFVLYGLPSMIFWEYASPIPGSALSCAFVAELISTRLAAAGGVVCATMAWVTEGLAPNCAAAAPPRRPNVSEMLHQLKAVASIQGQSLHDPR
jgi:hypothetical protein